MNEIVWTVLLVGVSCVGIWLAPRTWIGWAITTASEFLWAAYALHLRSVSLGIMSAIWFGLNLRGAVVTYRAQQGRVTSTP